MGFRLSSSSTGLTLGLVGSLAFGCGSSTDTKPEEAKDAIVFAGMYSSAGDGVVPPRQRAAEVFVEQINASGLLSRPVVLKGGTFDNTTDRFAMAKSLVDDFGATALVTELSRTAVEAIKVTNAPGYEHVVQCNGRATAAALTDSSAAIGDKTGAFYRTMATDTELVKVAWGLLPRPERTGLFILADAYGDGWRNALVAAASGSEFAFDQRFAPDWRDATEQPDVDDLLARNQRGDLDAVFIISHPYQFAYAIKALTEANPPFRGRIVGHFGGVSASQFDLATGRFASWLATPGNEIIQLSLNGPHSEAGRGFINGLASRWPTERFDDGMIGLHVDCMYAMALAMAYAEQAGKDPARDFKAYMQRMAPSSMDGVGLVPESEEGLRDAKARIAAGESLVIAGTSGPIVFDASGNRVATKLETFKAAGNGPYAWVSHQVWDVASVRCLSGCAQ